MKKEYKQVYDLVNKLGFSCDYIKYKNGFYSLTLFSKDYNCLGNGFKIYLIYSNLEELKQEIDKLKFESELE